MPVGISYQRSAEEKDNYYGKTSFPYSAHVHTYSRNRSHVAAGQKKWSTHPISSCAAHSFLLRRDRKKIFLEVFGDPLFCVCSSEFPPKKIGLSVAARIHKSCLSPPQAPKAEGAYSNEFSSSPETSVSPRFGISKFEIMLRFTLGKEIRKVFGEKRSGRPKMPDISALCDTEDLFDTLFLPPCFASLRLQKTNNAFSLILRLCFR